ncbi:MAG TPA: CocE/NonD family hydrolase [Mycobacteriales bacterium]|nr:CocE/NonD family hydrolase [Mycobacteriales bacterium]
MRTPRLALLSAALLASAVAVPSLAATSGKVTVTNGCVESVPDAGSTTPQKICYTLFKPAGADARHKVPMVLHSHGWGGSRTTDPASFKPFLDAGYGVLSFDQRGFGQDGGKARIENPAYEGKDVEKIVDLISKLNWVIQDGPGDPRLGSIGGSYGGGYQFVGAFTEIADKHKQVFDALAPEITWWDLKQSLAPQGVPKTEWVSLLTAAGVQALPPEILEGTAYAAATGLWPDGTVPGVPNLDAFFAKNGPKWQVGQGRRIDVPVLFRQGITDELFPLDQGLQNFAKALTPRARKHSIFVGYNGGHVLPNAYPLTVQPSGDPCSAQLTGGKDFTALTIRFFNHVLKHQKDTLSGYGQYHLATADNTCTTTDAVTPTHTFQVGTVATTELASPPLATKVADGPLRVAGTPYLDGDVTALGVNNRAFYALGIGTSPADVKIVQGDVAPWSSLTPVSGQHERIEMPSVAVNVPKGESLYVVAMATNDMFIGFGSRTPGAVVVQNAKVEVPLVQ